MPKSKCSVCQVELDGAPLKFEPCGHFACEKCLRRRRGACPECPVRKDAFPPAVARELRRAHEAARAFARGDEGAAARAEALSLRGAGLLAIPDTLGELGALKALDLSRNAIDAHAVNRAGALAGGGAWARLGELERLDLDDNALGPTPPDALFALSALSSLSLRGNGLRRLAPPTRALGELAQLATLRVGRNRLSELPRCLGALEMLATLDASHNEIGRLGGLSVAHLAAGCPALTSLDLSRNQLAELPAEVGRLGALRALRLARNALRALPPELGACGRLETRLETLALDHNRLVTDGVPAALGWARADAPPVGAPDDDDERRGRRCRALALAHLRAREWATAESVWAGALADVHATRADFSLILYVCR